ncbi:MAG: hypothetical protein U0575_05450 [Phycisphaerales bacterium]|jgi:hypothetical protein
MQEAVAGVLHSFHTGVESVMRGLAMLPHAAFAKSGSWHGELLDAMERGDGRRLSLLSSELAGALKMYLPSRRRFRKPVRLRSRVGPGCVRTWR